MCGERRGQATQLSTQIAHSLSRSAPAGRFREASRAAARLVRTRRARRAAPNEFVATIIRMTWAMIASVTVSVKTKAPAGRFGDTRLRAAAATRCEVRERQRGRAGRGLPVLEEELEAHAPVARLVRVLDPRVVPRRRVVVPEVDLVTALEALAQRHARRGAPAVGDGAALSVELRPLPEQPLLVLKVRDVRVREPVVGVLLAGRCWARAASAAPSPRRPAPAARRLPRRRAFGGRRLPLRRRLELCLTRRLL